MMILAHYSSVAHFREGKVRFPIVQIPGVQGTKRTVDGGGGGYQKNDVRLSLL